MTLSERLLILILDVKCKIDRVRLERRWAKLRQLGMHIGHDVLLPASTWIDTPYCFLISIGDHCGFGEGCFIVAHDAQMDEFLDAARIGRVVIHPSSHIGTQTIILPGVEIGPRTIVGANSLVSKSLPADSVCAGNPARVICSLEEYLERHRVGKATQPTFTYESRPLTPEARGSIRKAVENSDAYIVGGRSAELRGGGGTPRTSLSPFPRLRHPATTGFFNRP